MKNNEKGHKISRKIPFIYVCQISEGTGRGTTSSQRPSEVSSFTVFTSI